MKVNVWKAGTCEVLTTFLGAKAEGTFRFQKQTGSHAALQVGVTGSFTETGSAPTTILRLAIFEGVRKLSYSRHSIRLQDFAKKCHGQPLRLNIN